MDIQFQNFCDLTASFRIPTESFTKSIQNIGLQERLISKQIADIGPLVNESIKEVVDVSSIVDKAMVENTNTIKNLIAGTQHQMADFLGAQKQIVKDINLISESYLSSLGNIKSIAENFSAQNQELYSTIKMALSVLDKYQIKVPQSVIDGLNNEFSYNNWDVNSLEYQSSRGINLSNVKWGFFLSIVIFLLNTVFKSYESQTLRLEMENNYTKLFQKIEQLKVQDDTITEPNNSLNALIIVTKSVNLRDDPSVKSTSLIGITENDLVQTIEVKNDWIKVVYWDEDNATVHQGWVQSKFCIPFYYKVGS